MSRAALEGAGLRAVSEWTAVEVMTVLVSEFGAASELSCSAASRAPSGLRGGLSGSEAWRGPGSRPWHAPTAAGHGASGSRGDLGCAVRYVQYCTVCTYLGGFHRQRARERGAQGPRLCLYVPNCLIPFPSRFRLCPAETRRCVLSSRKVSTVCTVLYVRGMKNSYLTHIGPRFVRFAHSGLGPSALTNVKVGACLQHFVLIQLFQIISTSEV